MLVLNVVWSLISGLQICKLRSYRLYHMVQLKLVNLFVEKQVLLPATLPDIESDFMLFFAKITE